MARGTFTMLRYTQFLHRGACTIYKVHGACGFYMLARCLYVLHHACPYSLNLHDISLRNSEMGIALLKIDNDKYPSRT